ncbi:hypothetical protein SDC9_166216 [bioreactor metagenome]|uniref:Uncharacterized protein n=1 Tax=bioreactor metagenome TaxID=1076179 RepID=A0A645FWD2_9ZZZZ
MQRRVHGGNGHLQHPVVGRPGGQLLHHQPRPAQRVHQLALGMGQALQYFIAYAGHHGQKRQVAQKAQNIAVPPVSEQGVEQDGQHKHDQKEGGAAAGVQRGELPCVLRRQRQTVLMAVHGLVLRAVVLEGAPHVRDSPAKDHVADQNQNTRNALQQADEGF